MTVVASNYAREQNDLYQTEPWATEALLRHFPVENCELVWEPFAGNHLMADVLAEHGAHVYTSDIKTYDRPHNEIYDFLGSKQTFVGTIKIITNPAYGVTNRDAVAACRIALDATDGLVAMLLTAKFDFGSSRVDLFRDNPRFAAKIALLDRVQWFPGDKSGTEDHAWYVWGPAPGYGTGLARLIYERNQNAEVKQIIAGRANAAPAGAVTHKRARASG